jgi:hypothetical protein
MTRETTAGRVLVGIMFVGLGLVPLVTGHLPSGLIPLGEAALPVVLAGVAGLAVALAALAATATSRYPRAPLLLALLPALAVLSVQLPRLIATPRDPRLWTSGLELLAMVGGALLLHSTALPGRLLLATGLVGFGIQHFMYAEFVSNLVPGWMPLRLGLAYLTGTGFIAAAVSIVTGRYDRLGARCLALQFGIFVLTLHLPRIAGSPGIEAEWSSGLIALGFAGIALLVSGEEPPLPSAFRVTRASDLDLPAPAIAVVPPRH